jgi:hypothetical protein
VWLRTAPGRREIAIAYFCIARLTTSPGFRPPSRYVILLSDNFLLKKKKMQGKPKISGSLAFFLISAYISYILDLVMGKILSRPLDFFLKRIIIYK